MNHYRNINDIPLILVGIQGYKKRTFMLSSN